MLVPTSSVVGRLIILFAVRNILFKYGQGWFIMFPDVTVFSYTALNDL